MHQNTELTLEQKFRLKVLKKQTKNILPKWLRFILVIVLVLGICFRVINIDHKVYWHDEVLTSLRIAGYTFSEVDREIQDGDIISVKDLKKYQQINSDKRIGDTISSLAQDVHPPLYFLLARLWGDWFGNSVTVIRSLSVVFGLLALPCIYWLCLELFNSPAVGWIAMGLLSISPLHFLFAQEARMYSLYTVNILLSSAILLRAIRKKTKLNWLAYATTITWGLYTHLLFCLILVVHGIYVVINQGLRVNKQLIYYAIALGVGALSFFPWLLIIVTKAEQFNEQLNWLNETPSLAKIATYWFVNCTKIFFDFKADYRFGESIPHLLILTILGMASLGLLGYSIYYVYRNSSKKEYYFVLVLLFVPALLLAVPDLLLGGSRSIHLRYAIPTYLGCQLALAYVFAQKIGGKEKGNSVKQQTLWIVALIFVILIGFVSYSASFQNSAWWNKYHNTDNLAISRLINDEKSSVTLCYQCTKGSEFGNIISLSYHLSDRTKIQVLKEFDLTKIPSDVETVFLFNPPTTLQEEINNRPDLQLENVYQNYLSLWKL